MKEYIPVAKGTVTKYVFIESVSMTPGDLAIRAYEISQGAMIKETCFGLQVTGTADEVDRIVGALRALDPDHIFVKDRGFPPGDPRRCRADRGGARPGFHGHEFEMSLIRHVSAGLEHIREGKDSEKTEPAPAALPPEDRDKKLDASRLKKIIEALES
ncbi:MAG: methanogenesis marker 6 protein [Methanoregulaceae archaeon]|nr:methanogenesis marker 6 protein [Methanoregulaceae archaeon]